MTLPASGAISFEQIRDEFGGSDPISITDYYRGAGLVPDIPANANIPTSGAIVVPDDFWGATNAQVNVEGDSVIVVDTPSDAGYQLTSGGLERNLRSGTFATIGTWLLSGSAGDYQCRMTMVSGDNFSGSALNTWLALSTTRTWTLTDPVTGLPQLSGEGTIEIRLAATGAILDSATVNISSRKT